MLLVRSGIERAVHGCEQVGKPLLISATFNSPRPYPVGPNGVQLVQHLLEVEVRQFRSRSIFVGPVGISLYSFFTW
jgi:hypothetical protein